MAEIYARGPISCSVNSDVPAFNAYRYNHCNAFACAQKPRD
jgi:hypothetical protein